MRTKQNFGGDIFKLESLFHGIFCRHSSAWMESVSMLQFLPGAHYEISTFLFHGNSGGCGITWGLRRFASSV